MIVVKQLLLYLMQPQLLRVKKGVTQNLYGNKSRLFIGILNMYSGCFQNVTNKGGLQRSSSTMWQRRRRSRRKKKETTKNNEKNSATYRCKKKTERTPNKIAPTVKELSITGAGYYKTNKITNYYQDTSHTKINEASEWGELHPHHSSRPEWQGAQVFWLFDASGGTGLGGHSQSDTQQATACQTEPPRGVEGQSRETDIHTHSHIHTQAEPRP